MYTVQKNTKQQHEHHTRGLTVVEMVVTIAIFTLISVALVTSVLYFYRANSFAVEQAFAVESARRGVHDMVNDIREATFSDEGDYPVVAADEYAFEMYADVDADPNIERVRFMLDTTTFTLHRIITDATGTPATYVGGPTATTTIAEYVQNSDLVNPIFTYFDNTGTTTTNVADIAFVSVNLVVNVNPLRLPNEFTVRSSATIRNLKVNL